MQLLRPPPRLHDLPAELIDHILSFVSPLDLVSVSCVCNLLHDHSLNDTLWQPHANAQLPYNLKSPAPYTSFRELFTAHHPYWFLTRNQLWFADTAHTGKLLLARYSPQRQCIEAYSLNAQRGQHTFQFWEHDREVIIHTFHPTVGLDLNQPVLQLDHSAYRAANIARMQGAQSSDSSGRAQWPTKLQAEIPMATYPPTRLTTSGASLYNQFMLTRPIPSFLVGQTTQVWPPIKVPTPGGERTRNESVQQYRGLSHKPETWDEASTTSFRLRRWMEFNSRGREAWRMMVNGDDDDDGGGGIVPIVSPLGPMIDGRMRIGMSLHPNATRGGGGSGVNLRVGEDVTTYATLDKSAYTPTKDKPWRGIWVGDYSGHGCEFLAVLQPDEKELANGKRPLPVGAAQLIEEVIERDRLRSGGRLPHDEDTTYDENSNDDSNDTDENDSPRPMPGTFTEFDEPEPESSAGATNANDNGILASDSAYHIAFATHHMEEDEPTLLEILPAPQQDETAANLTEPSSTDIGEPVTEESAYRGRLEAIKLTGDPNIPRGEYTFIAPDIGPGGLIRVADEEIFRGARIVRSVGHIAARGYREDGYTPSQLILVSHDVLAQYWEAFGHISFYKRVDLDQFLKAD